MPLAATGSLLGAAARQRRAVAAFDVVTLDHVQAVVSGAEAADAPVVLQIGESAVQYHDGLLLPLAR
ncbi:MAG: class II fructose-bisphosphate aldolase, partial [Actinomycetia bacterium]|nr:class II fructose-bisphosphate aldolase [Actinomycetes bacterium]